MPVILSLSVFGRLMTASARARSVSSSPQGHQKSFKVIRPRSNKVDADGSRFPLPPQRFASADLEHHHSAFIDNAKDVRNRRFQVAVEAFVRFLPLNYSGMVSAWVPPQNW